MSSYYGIGIVSGPSLDGIDFCFAEFTGDADTDIWGYRIEQAITVPYTKEMKDRLANVTTLSGLELIQLNTDYSHHVGSCLRKFIDSRGLRPDLVASIGHTAFHQPDKGLTFQLGDGEIISIYISCPYICNFRTKDVALGGQGAPLVACGEKYLFQQTDINLNLGGIATVGFQSGDTGFDVCPCNIVLNHLATLYDPELSLDKDGQLSSTGRVLPGVLEELNKLEYYQQSGPKSVGQDWVTTSLLPILKPEQHSITDLLRTYIEHITTQITASCVKSITKPNGTVMVTGGGAYNSVLMLDLKEKLKKHKIQVVEAENEVVEYKQALVFAFLGLRSLLNIENIFSSVTGSRIDSVCGSIHHGTNRHSRPSLQDRFNYMIRQKSTGVNELRIIKEK